MARLYKAKYYADTDFMEAKMGGHPSFIWGSILEARQVISAGLNWRIGNGKDIKILNQPWLNSMDNPYFLTNSPSLENQMVSALLKPEIKEWDVNLVQDIFGETNK